MFGTTNPFDAQKKIEGVKHIIAVGAGKGGVGKSTISTNLAVALASKGATVGLLDADIYGPSIPKMMGMSDARPNVSSTRRIQPLVSHGVKTMSIGYLVDDKSAIIWRGPMLFKAMEQLINDVDWGPLDFLLVDLPPGTGDVQLSLVQKVPVSGAVVISTPQDVALLDVKRCVDMFLRVKTPIVGLVENMSTFVCPHCSESSSLFPAGGLHNFCAEKEIPIIANIPFDPRLAIAAEKGEPLPSSPEFLKAADAILRRFT